MKYEICKPTLMIDLTPLAPLTYQSSTANTLVFSSGDKQFEIDAKPVVELVIEIVSATPIFTQSSKELLLKLRGLVTKLAQKQVEAGIARISLSEREANALLIKVVEMHKPELLEYRQDSVLFKYEPDNDAWRIHAEGEFIVQNHLIKKGTTGGLVENPKFFVKSWVDLDSTVTGLISQVSNTYISNGSKVINSFVANSTVEYSRLIASVAYDSYVEGSFFDNVVSIDSRIHSSQLERALVSYYRPIVQVTFVGDSTNPLVVTHYKGVRYLPLHIEGVGTDEAGLTVGRGARNWDISINRGCFHGTLERFKQRIDDDLDRDALESEKYYGLVEYMTLKVASKRSDYMRDLINKMLIVYDIWLDIQPDFDSSELAHCLTPYTYFEISESVKELPDRLENLCKE